MKKITLLLTFFSFSFLTLGQISEGFETDPPTGWAFMQTEADDPGFIQTGALANSGSFSFYHNDDDVTVESTSWMISPSLAVSTGDVLSFYYRHNYTPTYGIENGIWISTTSADPIANPGDFTLLYDLLGNASEDAWTEYTQSLDAYDGQTVYFAFKYVGDYEDELYIDDFFAGAPPTDTLDYFNLQWPPNGTVELGQAYDVYAQAYEAGLTDVTSGQAPGVECWIGYNTSDTNPNGMEWTWIPANFNVEAGNNDEYSLNLGWELTSTGTYYYATRWRLNGGPYTYGGIQADGSYGGEWGTDNNVSGVLTITTITNDDLANATPTTCDQFYTGNTSYATLDEDNAPDGFGADMDAPNIWFSYDSAVEGAADVTVSLCGSLYDTSILVYTGTSGSLTAVAGNDDNDACGMDSLQSQATFTADGAQTYYIAVEGFNPTSVGAFVLQVTCSAIAPPPANDECANAEALTIGVIASGTTIGATQNGSEEQPTCDTFGTIADVWYSFSLSGNSDVTVSTTITGTSDQANVAVYSVCGGLQADQLGCADDNGGENLNLPSLDAGTYYVRVWSDGVLARSSQLTEGTFDIVVNATLSTNDLDSILFSYYPNPVKERLNITSQELIQEVTIYNMLGQRVSNYELNIVSPEIDLSNLKSGAYFVQIEMESASEIIRIVKE